MQMDHNPAHLPVVLLGARLGWILFSFGLNVTVNNLGVTPPNPELYGPTALPVTRGDTPLDPPLLAFTSAFG